MADYYPLLAKALANLPSRTTSTARRAIYDRARKALIGQLRSIQPPMPENDIAGEDAALDRAIARLEAEFGGQSTPPAAAAAIPKAPLAAPSPIPRANASIPRANPSVAPTAPSPGPKSPAAGPTRARAPRRRGRRPRRVRFRRQWLRAPLRRQRRPASRRRRSRDRCPPPAARRPSLGAASPSAPTLTIEPAKPAPTALSPSLAPSVEARSAASADGRSLAPPVTPSPPSVLAPPPVLKAPTDGARPSAPGRAEARRRNPWPMIAIALALGIAGAIALSAYFWREPTPDFAAKTKAGRPHHGAGEPEQDRRAHQGAADQADTPSAAGETPIPTVTVPARRCPRAGRDRRRRRPAPADAASPPPASPAAQAPAAAANDVVAQSPATADAQRDAHAPPSPAPRPRRS